MAGICKLKGVEGDLKKYKFKFKSLKHTTSKIVLLNIVQLFDWSNNKGVKIINIIIKQLNNNNSYNFPVIFKSQRLLIIHKINLNLKK